MRKLLFIVTALILTVTLMHVEAAAKGPKGGSSGGGKPGTGKATPGKLGSGAGNAKSRAGKGAGQGQGRPRARSYRGWTRSCWFPRYRCYGYHCPEDGLWYYWYGPGNCYRPVSDMDAYPPDDTMNPPPSLPPGATSVP
jgi:hypothetical protein